MTALGRSVVVVAVAATTGPPVPQAFPSAMDRYDFDRPVALLDLPGRLREISGLAFGDGGVLFAHADERAAVYRVDVRGSSVDRGFTLGDKPLRGDFEAIASVGERLFLVTSAGILYEFRAAAERESSSYVVSDLGIGERCEVEGMSYLGSADQLLVACKSVWPEASEVRILRIPLAPGASTVPPLRVPFALFEPFGLPRGIHPSGLDVDPETGHILVVAAREEAMAEIDLEGRVVSARRFGRSRHRQPEGIAFGPDGLLYVADEGDGRPARLTVYGLRRGGELP